MSSRFAVITPYYKESRDVLKRCITSVARQTVAADHFLIADGFPQGWLDGVNVRHIRLDRGHRDFGNTPRGLGALLAVAEGYAEIGFLDADNWYDADHVEVCSRFDHADVVLAQRRILLTDGTPAPVMEENDHCDTNCLWMLPGSFHLIPYWTTMPHQVCAVGDRVFYRALKAHGAVMQPTPKQTVNYVANWESLYLQLKLTPPKGAKPNVDPRSIIAWVKSLDTRQLDIASRRAGFNLLELMQ